MTGYTARRALGRLPWGLVGLLVAMLGIERFVVRHEMMLSTAESAAAQRADRAARQEAPKCEILCLGDSLVKFGVVPRVLESRLGRPAYNLALVGGPPPGTFFMLRRALRHGARPTAIVVDFKANVISTSPMYNKRQLAEMLTLSECVELGLTQGNLSECASLILHKLLPSFKARQEIRPLVVAALAGQVPPGLYAATAYVRNTNVNRGAIVMDEEYLIPVPGKEALNQVYFPANWDIHPINARYIRRFFELAAAARIPVFWVLPPIQAQIQAERDAKGLDKLYLRRAYGLRARFPNLWLVDGRHAGFPGMAFFDTSHLNRSGAQALSAALAGVIGPVLDGGSNSSCRVIELPRFRAFALDPLPEDLDSSRAALGLARLPRWK
jgi:hypothetical protein